MTITNIEQEFEDSLENIIRYFNDPKNDYMGIGFGIKNIAGILGVDTKTLYRWCKRRNIKVAQRPRIYPDRELDDRAWVKYGMNFESYLKLSSYCKRWSEICQDLDISWHTVHSRFSRHKLYGNNPHSKGSEQKRRVNGQHHNLILQ